MASWWADNSVINKQLPMVAVGWHALFIREGELETLIINGKVF